LGKEQISHYINKLDITVTSTKGIQLLLPLQPPTVSAATFHVFLLLRFLVRTCLGLDCSEMFGVGFADKNPSIQVEEFCV
jgi:hypothetical protein